MEMEYRRLGRSGLKVSVLSFGSWVTFGPNSTRAWPRTAWRRRREAGVNFFDNAESYSGGESERIMGKALARLGWPRHSYVVSTKLFWGIHDEVNMQQHPQPQVPAAGHRRLAGALRPRLRRPAVLPPRRPRDAHRGDGVGHVGHRELGPGPVLGDVGVDGRRDPRRMGDRRAPQPPQAGHGAAAVQHPRAPQGRDRSTPASTTRSAWASPPGARWRRACSPASTSTASPKAAGPPCPATSGSRACSPTSAATRR